MKKSIFSILLLTLSSGLLGQCLQSKDAFIDYFKKYSASLDPIEGIWTLNCVTTIYYNGSLYSEHNAVVLSKWAIKRESEISFGVCDISEGQNSNEASTFKASFETSAIGSIYTYKCNYSNPNWIGKAIVELNEGVILDYTFQIADVAIRHMMQKNYKTGITAYWHFIWTKTYPTINTSSHNNSSVSSGWTGNGSGFFIDKNGYIATNFHVIDGASEIEVDLVKGDQKQSFKAKVISSDKQNDLSIIKIEDKNFNPFEKLPYSFKATISDVGSSVFALGYPMALTIMGDEVKFTDGKISSKTGFQGDITTYQISVPVQPGSSGGPLFDYDGNIIGIVNAKIMAADNVSYAIKLAYLNNLIDVLPDILSLPNDISIAQKPLTEKIKELSNYVVLIKIR